MALFSVLGRHTTKLFQYWVDMSKYVLRKSSNNKSVSQTKSSGDIGNNVHDIYHSVSQEWSRFWQLRNTLNKRTPNFHYQIISQFHKLWTCPGSLLETQVGTRRNVLDKFGVVVLFCMKITRIQVADSRTSRPRPCSRSWRASRRHWQHLLHPMQAPICTRPWGAARKGTSAGILVVVCVCVSPCFIKLILGNHYVRSRDFIVSDPKEMHPRSEIADATSPCRNNLGSQCLDPQPLTGGSLKSFSFGLIGKDIDLW